MNSQAIQSTNYGIAQRKSDHIMTGWIALIVMIFCSASYNVFAKMLGTALSPMTLVFFSELLAVGFVLLTFGTLPILRELFSLPRGKYLPLLGLGIANSIIAPALIFYGLDHTTAVNAALFGNSEMLFLLFFAYMFFREKLDRPHIMALCVIVFGLIIVALRGFHENFSINLGDLMLIGAGLSFGIGDTIFRRYLSAVHPHVIVLGRSSIAVSACILYFALHPLALTQELHSFPVVLLPVLLGFGFFSRFVNLVTFYDAMEMLPVSIVALFSYLSIVVSMIFAWWLLAESIQAYHLIGGALIIGGAISVELKGKHHPSEEHYKAHLQQRRFSRS